MTERTTMERWRLRLDWGWGTSYRFQETHETVIYSLDEIPGVIRDWIARIADRYAYDCGVLEKPLNPHLCGYDVTPIQETERHSTAEFDAEMAAAITAKRERLEEAERERQAKYRAFEIQREIQP